MELPDEEFLETCNISPWVLRICLFDNPSSSMSITTGENENSKYEGNPRVVKQIYIDDVKNCIRDNL